MYTKIRLLFLIMLFFPFFATYSQDNNNIKEAEEAISLGNYEQALEFYQTQSKIYSRPGTDREQEKVRSYIKKQKAAEKHLANGDNIELACKYYEDLLEVSPDSEYIKLQKRKCDSILKKRKSSIKRISPPNKDVEKKNVEKKDTDISKVVERVDNKEYKWLNVDYRNTNYPDSLYYTAFVQIQVHSSMELALNRARVQARNELAKNIKFEINSRQGTLSIGKITDSVEKFQSTFTDTVFVAVPQITVSNAQMKDYYSQTEKMVYAFAYLNRESLENYYIDNIQDIIHKAKSEVNRILTQKNGQKIKLDSFISEVETQIKILASINPKQEKIVTFRKCVTELKNELETIIVTDKRTKSWYHYINSPFIPREQFYGAKKTVNTISLGIETGSLIIGTCYILSAYKNYNKHKGIEANTVSEHTHYYEDYKNQLKTGKMFLIIGVGAVWVANSVIWEGCDYVSGKYKRKKTILAPTLLCDTGGNYAAGLAMSINF